MDVESCRRFVEKKGCVMRSKLSTQDHFHQPTNLLCVSIEHPDFCVPKATGYAVSVVFSYLLLRKDFTQRNNDIVRLVSQLLKTKQNTFKSS